MSTGTFGQANSGCLADSDLQLVLQAAGASLDTQYKVQVHTTRRRFQAIADNRAEARLAAEKDIGLHKSSSLALKAVLKMHRSLWRGKLLWSMTMIRKSMSLGRRPVSWAEADPASASQ